MYVLIQDDDCHWYVIPSDKVDDWDVWLESLDWNIPDYAVPVDGSQVRVTFDAYTIK